MEGRAPVSPAEGEDKAGRPAAPNRERAHGGNRMDHEIYGYIRVSSKDQNEDRQLLAMRDAGVAEDHISEISSCIASGNVLY